MENRIIGERIARRRKTLGMTQKQLADRLHITDRAVSRWERGVGAPDLSLIVPLCEALSMSTDELLRGIPSPAQHTRRNPDDKPVLIPFRHVLFTVFIPPVWFVLTLILLCIPQCPDWLLLTSAFLMLPLALLSQLVCVHLFFRCPRCGHILWHFSVSDWHGFRSSLFASSGHCHVCGQALFVDNSALYRLLDFFKNDRPE